MSLRAISPNQFAFPGMEEGAHPGAKYLTEGVAFHTHKERGEHFLMASTKGPSEFDVDRDYHSSHTLQWRDHHDYGNYPGEISWVSRSYPRRGAGGLNHRGIMAAMFHMAHQQDIGQSTVPIHSPDRTPEGEAWAQKVGPAHLRPRRSDYDWLPPKGVHPFEEHDKPPAEHDLNQGELWSRHAIRAMQPRRR